MLTGISWYPWIFVRSWECKTRKAKHWNIFVDLSISTFVVKHEYYMPNKQLASAIIIWNEILSFKLICTVRNQPHHAEQPNSNALKWKTGENCAGIFQVSHLCCSLSMNRVNKINTDFSGADLSVNAEQLCFTHKRVVPVTFDLSSGTHSLGSSSRSC